MMQPTPLKRLGIADSKRSEVGFCLEGGGDSSRRRRGLDTADGCQRSIDGTLRDGATIELRLGQAWLINVDAELVKGPDGTSVEFLDGLQNGDAPVRTARGDFIFVERPEHFVGGIDGAVIAH